MINLDKYKTSYKMFIPAIFCIAFILYIWALLRYTVNLPFWDDYDAVLGFLNNYINSNGLNKILLLLSQHNEHRILWNRIVEYLEFKIFGEVNFLYLVLVGNLGWFLVIYILWKYMQKLGFGFIEFSGIGIILLSFSHWEIMTFPMGSIQQYYQALFSIISIYLLLVDKKFLSSLFFMIMSVFTGGGGFVLVPIFLLYLYLNKQWKHFSLTILISILIVLLYFVILQYQHPSHYPPISEVFKNPIGSLKYFVLFIGSLGKYKTLSYVLGILFIVAFFVQIYLYAKKVISVNELLFPIAIEAWVIGTAMVTLIGRMGFGVEQALSSRYTIYSLLMFASILLSSLIWMRKIGFTKRTTDIFIFTYTIISLVVFLFHFGSELKNMSVRKELLISGLLAYPNQERAESILIDSYRNGVFRQWRGVQLPSNLLNVPRLDISNKYCLGIAKKIDVCDNVARVYHSDKLSKPIVIISKKEGFIEIEGWTVDNISKKHACGAYIILKSNNTGYRKIHFLTLYPREDVAKFFKNDHYLFSGINYKLDVRDLLPGEYTLLLRTVNNNCSSYFESISVKVVLLE